MSATTTKHPARFSKAVLAAIRPVADHFGLPVHDPFAGDGIRLAALCDTIGLPFSGGDIECWPGHDPRVFKVDATLGASYPRRDVLIVTSPVYPNGMADHFVANDDSRRYTYRSALGHDLHTNNAGRYSIRGGNKAINRYWLIQHHAVRHWRGPCCVNVSDFIHQGTTYRLVARWGDLLHDNGFEVIPFYVKTPRMRNGANRDLRVGAEAILIGIPQPVPTDEEFERRVLAAERTYRREQDPFSKEALFQAMPVLRYGDSSQSVSYYRRIGSGNPMNQSIPRPVTVSSGFLDQRQFPSYDSTAGNWWLYDGARWRLGGNPTYTTSYQAHDLPPYQ